MEFAVVGIGEDLIDRTPFTAGDQRGALAQPRAKRGMRHVGGGFGKRRDGERLRRHAMAEPRNLRKDEPHPVAALAAGTKLSQHGRIYGLLRVDEPLQSKAIVHRPRGILRVSLLTSPARSPRPSPYLDRRSVLGNGRPRRPR